MSNYLNKNFVINLSIILFIFIFDRLSKLYVIYLSQKNLNLELYTSTYLNILLIWNDGIAFGLLSSKDNFFYNLTTCLILVVILILIFLISKSKGFKRFSYIMVIGGAFGNLFDRIMYKSVPDFIDVHFNGFHWFIFNIADIFICIGVFFMILIELNYNNKGNETV